jgi:chaperonin cofactor prefoldin
MARTATLNREQPSRGFHGGLAIEKKQQPSLEELAREVEVLRGKLQSLRTAHERIEREAQRLTELLQAVQITIKLKAGAA